MDFKKRILARALEVGIDGVPELAKRAGLKYNTLRDFLKTGPGPGRRVRIEILTGLSRALRMTVDEVIGHEPPEPGPDLALRRRLRSIKRHASEIEAKLVEAKKGIG